MTNREWLKSKRSKNKIPAHYGMYDYYKFFTKNNPNIEIDRTKFNKVISEFNEILCKYLIENLEYNLPFRLGKLEVLKEERELYLDEKTGKVKDTNPPNWKETLKLWDSNKEAREKKILIRHNNNHTGGYVFRIYYNKSNAIYKNKKIYFFKPIRSLKRSITKRINDYSKQKYDTYIKK